MTISMKKAPQKTTATGTDLPFALQLIALDKVKESPRNAKKHTPAQIAAIVHSIQTFKFRDPIALDKNYEIVEGHGRVLALKSMGASSVPALVFHDMTAEEVRAYRIAHNQLTLSTGFDIEALTIELRDLHTSGFELATTGFTVGDLDSFELQLETHTPGKGTASAAEPAAGSGEESGSAQKPVLQETAATYQYVLIFDDKEQHQKWGDFIKWLKANREGETIAQRVTDFVAEATGSAL
jgi:ParB-like chromosome segregation protein Spo0J